jgi:Ca2+-binding EF-hand superfamily protein
MQMEELQPIRESPSRSRSPAPKALAQGNALSQLQPSQVRTLREGFQILDRDSDGNVGRDDIADMLKQLGKSSCYTRYKFRR